MSLYTTQKRTQTHAQRKNKIRPIFLVYRRYFLTICAVGGKKILKRRFYPPFFVTAFCRNLKTIVGMTITILILVVSKFYHKLKFNPFYFHCAFHSAKNMVQV